MFRQPVSGVEPDRDDAMGVVADRVVAVAHTGEHLRVGVLAEWQPKARAQGEMQPPGAAGRNGRDGSCRRRVAADRSGECRDEHAAAEGEGPGER
jgi:hypothetical protein